MKKVLNCFLAFILFSGLNAQQVDFNLSLLSEVFYPEGCNDIWGYVDDNGIEYALIGTRTATVVLSLEDPANPVERLRVDGDQSTWRDIKVWAKRAYVTTGSGDDGLLIINMEKAPNNITFEYQNTEFMYRNTPYQLELCHNIFIDDKGIMFLSGCNRGSNGVLMFDLNEDPDKPKFLGAESKAYSHDAYSRNDILYSSDLSQGLSIWDVSDPKLPVELGRKITTTAFTHNGWLSDDENYFFTTDERGNAYLDAYDITDKKDIKLLDSYRPKSTEGLGVIPHNTHYYDGYLVTSWYTDGVKIIDGSRPHNLIEVGSYDTWPGRDGGFSGCWGAFPWLPSGTVLAADITRGLIVLQSQYERACFLEGNVTNNLDFSPVKDVEINIQSNFDNLEISNFDGDYATGQSESGTFDVSFSHPDFQDTVISVDLVNGQVVNLDVELRAKPFFRINCNVIDAITKDPIDNASVIFKNDFRTVEGVTDNKGEVELIVFDEIDNFYSIYAGFWGYLHGVLDSADFENQITYTLELEEGYQDDFIFDHGWVLSGDAARGEWVRDDPIGTTVNGEVANPIDDVDSDLGVDCYVTGNLGGNAGVSDVDDGVTIITSPIMDLVKIKNAEIIYRTWFYDGSRPDPNDSMRVRLSNGMEEVTLELITESGSTWHDTSRFKVSDYISPTKNMQLIVEVYDDIQVGHVVEGAFDEFRVIGKITTSSNDEVTLEPSVTPTIMIDQITINDMGRGSHKLRMTSIEGKMIMMKVVEGRTASMNVSNLVPGSYLLQIENEDGKVFTKKLVKQ